MDEEQERLQKVALDIMNDIDRKCLRKMQIQMHLCSIDCCKDTTNNIKTLETCHNNCSRDFMSAQTYIQNEFNRWQQRILHCVQDCDDTVNDKMGKNRNDVIRHMNEVKACASTCLDKYIKLLPQISENIVDTLSKNKP